MKKKFGKYYLGMDIGTSSVGWAVTDLDYKVMKFNGKSMWGIRLFDEAKTAEERRMHRSSRRRNERRKQRIKLLQELFSEEISKVDFCFFMRVKDSALWEEDKRIKQKNGLFNDDSYKDEDYYAEFPTIYHLRRDLATSREPRDVRLVYLAVHHILKHRGHFLYDLDFSGVSELPLEPLLEELKEVGEDYAALRFSCTDTDRCRELLCDQEMRITDKKKEFEKIFTYEESQTKRMKTMFSLLSGGKSNLKELFEDDSLSDGEQKTIAFEDSSYEENEELYRAILQDRFALIEKAKQIYDWGILRNILPGEKSISEVKAELYDRHHSDLIQLKAAVKLYCPAKYKQVFGKPVKGKANYSAYAGTCDINGRKQTIEKRCNCQEFCDFLKKDVFRGITIDDELFPGLKEEIEEGKILPRQRNKDNGVIPFQIHRQELIQILENAATYLPFLEEKDEHGLTVKEKIVAIMNYRIPYYVGPVNTSHENGEKGFCWAVRKKEGTIRPWNFDEMVDREASAEKFIRRMTNKCTYLHGEDVIPKDSLLYSRYMVLNELNNLRIDGEKISLELKQRIYCELFLKRRKVTRKNLRDFLKAEGYGDSFEISGIDGDFKSSMRTYVDFKSILKKETFSDQEKKMIDDIVRVILVFSEDKKMLKTRIRRLCGDRLNTDQISEILRRKYTGWGRFSEKFLTGIGATDPSTGECLSVINLLYNDPANPNLMQLLSNDYPFMRIIEKENRPENSAYGIAYSDVQDLQVSVPVKRSIWQTISIVKELMSILGHEPEKVFIEMSRGSDPKKMGRTVSRKTQLLELYKNCRSEEPELYEELGLQDDEKLRGDKLYLYYTQLGRCMYTGKRIELESLTDYDIDHIYPQSKVMDNSIDNRVLVLKSENAKKGDSYPVKESIRKDMTGFWKLLYHKKLISKIKFERLTRSSEFSIGELEGFVSRQLVETRQSTKAVAQLLESYFKKTEVVHVKAANVAAFRNGIDNFSRDYKKRAENREREANRFIKSRLMNDYHHAKDAYLNIVVGNVFHSKFTHSPHNFFQSGDGKYSFNAMYKFPIIRNGVVAWLPASETDEGTMAMVKAQMRKNDILYTRYATEVHGEFFAQQPLKRGKGQVPLKGAGRLTCIEKYGGYNNAKGAYFFIVEHQKKGKRVRSIETVFCYKKNEIRSETDLLRYCTEFLKLDEPKILMKKIKKDSLFSLDGFRMHITGRQGNQLVFKNAVQLVISEQEQITYVKKIENYMARKKENRNSRLTSFDGIDKEKNLQLYRLLLSKLKSTVYQVKLSAQIPVLEAGLEPFGRLDAEEQCAALIEILKFFRCDRSTSDLRFIGGKGSVGNLLLAKNITKQKDLLFISQSVTGLFERKVKFGE